MHGDKLLLFCATVIPLAFTPGPDVIYILTRGIAQEELGSGLVLTHARHNRPMTIITALGKGVRALFHRGLLALSAN